MKHFCVNYYFSLTYHLQNKIKINYSSMNTTENTEGDSKGANKKATIKHCVGIPNMESNEIKIKM